jgi:arylsulfatase A-like enzyme
MSELILLLRLGPPQSLIWVNAKLTRWPTDQIEEWDQLNADGKKLFVRQVEVFAAYVAYADNEIGRVISNG